MPRKRGDTDPTIQALFSIKSTLQDLLVIELARSGLKKDAARRIAGVSSDRVSRIWKQLKAKDGS